MNSKLWIQKALSSCLLLAMIASYSMITLAGTGKAAGELSVFGKTANGETPFVLVNGEAAQNGRTIFSNSNISTSESVSALVNMGTAGQIEIAPATTLSLSFDDAGSTGILTAGSITAIGGSIDVRLANGDMVKLNAGETVAATGARAQDDDDDDGAGGAWVPWVIIFGGATAGIIWAALEGDNNANFGGGGVVVSPTS